MTRASAAIGLFVALWLVDGCTVVRAPGGERERSLSIILAGAPAEDLASASATIAEVQVADGASRSTVRSEPWTVDLVALAGTPRIVVHDVTLPDRTGQTLHFLFSGAMIEVADAGGSLALHATPDYAPAAGLPVSRALQMPDLVGGVLDVEVGELPPAGETADLLVRFDAAESFLAERGAWGSWVMRPALEVLPLSESASMMVAVALAPGVVLPAGIDLERFEASLVDADGNVEAVAPLVDGEGGAALATFELLDAREGPFSCRLDARGVRYAVAEPEWTTSWIVAPGDAAMVDVTLTEVEAL